MRLPLWFSQCPYALAAGVRHGAVALNITDYLPVIVPNLQAARAGVVYIPEALVVLVSDRPACRGLGFLPAPARPPTVAAIVLKLEAPRIRRHGSGDQDHGQDGP